MIFLGFKLAGGFLELGAQLLGLALEVDIGQHLADRLGADIGGEGIHAVGVLRVHELFLGQHLTVGEIRQARLDHHVVLEIEHPLQIAQRHVEHQPDARGQRFQEPDMRAGRGQLDMAHALAPDLLQRDLDAAFLADDAAVLHALVLAAQALVILDRAEDARAEQPVPLGLERAVVDGLGLLDLAVGPERIRSGEARLTLISSKTLAGATGLNGLFVSSWFIFKSSETGVDGGMAPFSLLRKRTGSFARIRCAALTHRPPHPGVPC